MGFNKRSIKLLNAYGGEGFLCADISSSKLNRNLRLVNIYSPCHNRELFWNRLMEADFMQSENLIIRGDLNFSLGLVESWGNWA